MMMVSLQRHLHRALLAVLTGLALAACSPAAETPKPEAAVETPVDPKIAARDKKEKDQADALAKQKPEFDAALAAKDEAKIDDLATNGNGWALWHRGQARIASPDAYAHQGGFDDIEEAANLGVAEAQVWVGTRMAYGLQGYDLKPNSGLMMLERAARQGNEEAILATGLMYEQDTFMRDTKKAREWYQKGVDLGFAKAKEALEKLGTDKDIGEPM